MRRALAVLALAPLMLFAAPDEKLPPDLALVPHDALWFASVRAADVRDDARGKLALTLLVKGEADPLRALEDTLGVKVADLERVTAFQRRMKAGPPVILYGKKALTNVSPQAGVYQRNSPIRWPLSQKLNFVAEVRNDAITRRGWLIIQNIILDNVRLITETKNKVPMAVVAVVLHDVP